MPEDITSLLDTLRGRQFSAWQSGERLEVESLIQSEGELLTDDEVLELIYAEIMLRTERGDICAIDEYLRRFPQFTESLQRLFAIHQALEANPRSLPEQSTPAAPGASTAADMRKIVMIGSRLGPYLLLEKLGHGGMGDVYKARHLKLGRIVALKVLASHLLTRPIALLRFEREMLAVGSLQHPNIVQAFDAGEVDGVHYLSMEYVDGQDLGKILTTTGPMSVIEACESIRQAALGLAAAHRQGLVHRDIKPSNLFVTKQTQQIKILDLGLALLSQEASTGDLTSTGQCFGTADYMAPEQWEDAHTCDARADLYALGCTLFALLVGRPPYGDDTCRTVPRKMKGHVSDPIPDLVANRPDVPHELDLIYRKLMAKQPEDRFASAEQLAEALTAFCNEAGVTARLPQPMTETSSATSLANARRVTWLGPLLMVSALSAGLAANFENVFGGSADDVITGNAANNLLMGNGGSDTLAGGDGSDELDGGDGNDLLKGGNQDDVLIGGIGDDYLKGEAGNDSLNGGDGFNTLVGGVGNDLYTFQAATVNQVDTVNELVDEGTDTLDFSTLTTVVTVNLTSDTALAVMNHRIVQAGVGQSAKIENVAGGSANDQIPGNAANNLLSGNGGNDTISGGGGHDILIGGDGTDTLKGISGLNILIGGAGADLLLGGTGEDLMMSGSTVYDTNPALLQYLAAEWTSGNTYQTRVDHLLGTTPGGANLGVTLNPTTAHSDPDADYLTGGAGRDWFLAGSLQDVLTDQAIDEVFTHIDTWL